MVQAADGRQSAVNERVWATRDFVRRYASRTLRPPEVTLLLRYRDDFAGRVLELGCGAGRVAGYLAAIAREFRGIDISPAMVAYCRSRYPDGSFDVGDLRDLAAFEAGSFDVVFAGYNVLDVLDDGERQRVLRDVAALLAPGGLLVMSSHNLAHGSRIRPPHRIAPTANPLLLARRLAGAAVGTRNHRRLRALEQVEERYAILNDEAERYSLLHYYVSRDEQERQLAGAGLALLECLDEDARPVAAGEQAPAAAELHYAARRSS